MSSPLHLATPSSITPPLSSNSASYITFSSTSIKSNSSLPSFDNHTHPQVHFNPTYPLHKSSLKSMPNMSSSTIIAGTAKSPDTPPTSNASEEEWMSKAHYTTGQGTTSSSSTSGKLGGVVNWDRVIGGERKGPGNGFGLDWRQTETNDDPVDASIKGPHAHSSLNVANLSPPLAPISNSAHSSVGGHNEGPSTINRNEEFYYQSKGRATFHNQSALTESGSGPQATSLKNIFPNNFFGEEQIPHSNSANLENFGTRNDNTERARTEAREDLVHHHQLKREQLYAPHSQRERERDKDSLTRQNSQSANNNNFHAITNGNRVVNGNNAYSQLRMEDPSFSVNHFDPLLTNPGVNVSVSQSFNPNSSVVHASLHDPSVDLLYTSPTNLEQLQAIGMGLNGGGAYSQQQQQQGFNQPVRQIDNHLAMQHQILREREQAVAAGLMSPLHSYNNDGFGPLKSQLSMSHQLSGLNTADISTLAASAPFGSRTMSNQIIMQHHHQPVSFGLTGLSSPSSGSNQHIINQNNLQMQHIQAALSAANQLPGGSRDVSVPSAVTGHSTSQVNATSQQQEEISTIFVVGFPEDMQEREFQNMFIFAQGFEAATLKIPAAQVAAREKEMHAASVAAAASGVMVPGKQVDYGFSDGYGNQLVEAHSAFLSGANGQNMSDAVPNNATTTTTRKQIIGFAKFRTKAEAIIARDMLAARRVDAEKGSVLKAEMAKKNLHTKRGLLNDPIPPTQAIPAMQTNLPPGNTASQQALQSALYFAGQQAVPTAQSARDVQQLIALQQRDRDTVEREREQRERVNQLQANSKVFDAFQSVPNQNRQTNSNAQFDTQSLYNETFSPQFPQNIRFSSNDQVSQLEMNPRSERAKRTSSASPDFVFDRPANQSPPSTAPAAVASPGSRSSLEHQFTRTLLQQLDEHEETPAHLHQGMYLSEFRRLNGSQTLYSHAEEDDTVDLVSRMSGLGMTYLSNVTGESAPSPTSLNSPTFARTQNPGDNNPPISTLYIGLPSVVPSTSGAQSAQTLEENLRSLFSRCPGYRRLSFRQKANNNICHVEFDSVEHASQTKDMLQGNTLGGLVKTGIRISYSKNPLGIRSGSLSNGSVSPGAMSPTGLGPTDISMAALGPQGSRRPSESIFTPSDYNHYYNRSRGTMRSPDAGSSTSPPPLSLAHSNNISFSG